MCPPDFYQVDYVINVWMEGNVDRSSQQRAAEQWRGLEAALRACADVELVRPAEGWPDLVFTANAGLVLGDKVVLSRFLHPERQGEEPIFKAWFERAGFTVHELPEDLPFEGAGRCVIRPRGPLALGGLRAALRTRLPPAARPVAGRGSALPSSGR